MERPAPQLGTQQQVVGKRIVAWIVDIVILGFVTGLISGALVGISTRLAGLAGLLATIITFGYFIYLEGTYGQTVGKQVMNIVVVTQDGDPCDMRASAIRNVLRIIDNIPFIYLVGLVVIYLTDDRQRIGDLAASTIVVETV